MNEIEKQDRVRGLVEELRLRFEEMCRPDQPIDVRIVLETIHANLFKHDLTVAQVLEHCGIGDTSYTTHFRDHVGLTIGEYIKRRRLQVAQRLLKEHKDLYVSSVADIVGYRYRTFVRLFKNVRDCTPTQYRKSNEGINRIVMQEGDDSII